MPIRFVLDENLRGKPIWYALQQSLAAGPVAIDAVRVGDPLDLPLGSPDPSILIWAEDNGRILISEDARSLPAHLANHLRGGRKSPGIFVIRPNSVLAAVLHWLELVVIDNKPDQWVDQLIYIP